MFVWPDCEFTVSDCQEQTDPFIEPRDVTKSDPMPGIIEHEYASTNITDLPFNVT